MEYIKHPRTLHLPFSEHVTTDDKILKSVEHFIGKEIVVSSKLDGENTSMYTDHIHARSLDSRHHDSRNLVKSIHGEICSEIPWGWRVVGENCYAMHSIFYDKLPSYFLVFSVWNELNECLSWDETLDWASLLQLDTVPVLYRGVWDEIAVRACWTGVSKYGSQQEGYVVRTAGRFGYDDFAQNVAKYVSGKFVAGIAEDHWSTAPITPNLLAKK